jgi:hypothetical protein
MERRKQPAKLPRLNLALRYGLGGAAVLAISAAILGFSEQQQGPPPTMTPGTGPSVDRPFNSPETDRLPDANDQMRMNEQQQKKKNYEAANLERKRQIAEDAARLLQLATELKSEVDKTDKDTLSLNVIRKAETIEKLAKGVKEKMKLTVGAS